MTREEAIKELRGFIGQLTEGCQEAIRVLIPELAESEDERIRKWLVDYFSSIKEAVWIHRDITCEQILAWLEKQKEQKPAEWSEEDIKIMETICKEGDLKPSEKRWLKSLRSQPKRKQSPALKKIVDNLTEEKLAKTRAEMKLEDAAEPVDLEKELEAFLCNYEEDGDAISYDIARHFYELGKKGGNK